MSLFTTKEIARVAFAKNGCTADIDTCELVADIVLHQVIGMNSALSKEDVFVDLGNGHMLVCAARKNLQHRPLGPEEC